MNNGWPAACWRMCDRARLRTTLWPSGLIGHTEPSGPKRYCWMRHRRDWTGSLTVIGVSSAHAAPE